jgi:soluble lytic murein transglycosylase
MSTFQLTALGVGIVLAACGVARAQPAYPAAPSYYTPPSPVAAYGQGLSPTDAQGLLMALTAARSGDSARVREAMAGLSDPLAGKIALWALADTAPDSLGEQETDRRAEAAARPGARRRVRDRVDGPDALQQRQDRRRSFRAPATNEPGAPHPESRAVLAWPGG